MSIKLYQPDEESSGAPDEREWIECGYDDITKFLEIGNKDRVYIFTSDPELFREITGNNASTYTSVAKISKKEFDEHKPPIASVVGEYKEILATVYFGDERSEKRMVVPNAVEIWTRGGMARIVTCGSNFNLTSSDTKELRVTSYEDARGNAVVKIRDDKGNVIEGTSKVFLYSSADELERSEDGDMKVLCIGSRVVDCTNGVPSAVRNVKRDNVIVDKKAIADKFCVSEDSIDCGNLPSDSVIL